MEVQMSVPDAMVIIDGVEYPTPKPVVHLLLKTRHELMEWRTTAEDEGWNKMEPTPKSCTCSPGVTSIECPHHGGAI